MATKRPLRVVPIPKNNTRSVAKQVQRTVSEAKAIEKQKIETKKQEEQERDVTPPTPQKELIQELINGTHGTNTMTDEEEQNGSEELVIPTEIIDISTEHTEAVDKDTQSPTSMETDDTTTLEKEIPTEDEKQVTKKRAKKRQYALPVGRRSGRTTTAKPANPQPRKRKVSNKQIQKDVEAIVTQAKQLDELKNKKKKSPPSKTSSSSKTTTSTDANPQKRWISEKGKKKRRYSEQTRMQRRVIKEQKNSVNVAIPKASIQRLIREILQDVTPNREICRMSREALEAIHVALEHYLINLFAASTFVVARGDRVTLFPEDMRIVKTIRAIT